jgi:hypothetical protein
MILFGNFRVPALIALLASLSATHAAAGWDEAIDGDLSGDYQNPTVVELVPGVNTLRATSGSTTALDVEYFRIDLEAGWQLDAIILRDFVSTFDSVAFIGVQEGSSFTFPASEAFNRSDELLGWAHFGPFEDDDFDAIGKNFLPQMGMNGPIGFSGPLTGPSYTFWSQQQGQPITYELEFVVSAVPEPATLTGVFAALLLGACGRRSN